MTQEIVWDILDQVVEDIGLLVVVEVDLGQLLLVAVKVAVQADLMLVLVMGQLVLILMMQILHFKTLDLVVVAVPVVLFLVVLADPVSSSSLTQLNNFFNTLLKPTHS